MADNSNETSIPKPNRQGRRSQQAIEKQVAQLKREIAKINKTLADRAEEAVETAGGWYEDASDRASRAAQQLRTQAHTVSETVKDNPGTISSAMLLGGIIGVLVGWAIAHHADRHHRWY